MRNDSLVQGGATESFTKAGLAEGTAANTIKTAAPNGAGVDFAIGGVAYHKADTDSIAMNALAAQAADTTCLYLVQIDSAGAVTLKKGVERSNAGLAAGNEVLEWPQADANRCALGAVKVKTVAVTFTSGTTDLSAAGITATYYDFAGGQPDKPLTS